jgi:hypothetical protein
LSHSASPFFLFYFWQYWGLNWGPHTCYAGALSLEPLHQPIPLHPQVTDSASLHLLSPSGPPHPPTVTNSAGHHSSRRGRTELGVSQTWVETRPLPLPAVLLSVSALGSTEFHIRNLMSGTSVALHACNPIILELTYNSLMRVTRHPGLNSEARYQNKPRTGEVTQ